MQRSLEVQVGLEERVRKKTKKRKADLWSPCVVCGASEQLMT